MLKAIQNLMRDERQALASIALDDQGCPLARYIFFDPDDWSLRSEYADVLAAHAHYLKTHPDQVSLLSGHCCGATSQRFAWLIGERRARSVQAALSRYGVAQDQLLLQSTGRARRSDEIWPDLQARYSRRVIIDVLRRDSDYLRRHPLPGSSYWWQRVLDIRLKTGSFSKASA